MVADSEIPVYLTAHIPGGTPITGGLGAAALPLQEGAVHLPDVYRAIGELLVEAGQYMIEQGAPPNPPRSPDADV